MAEPTVSHTQSWHDLYTKRMQPGVDHSVLAPMEHRAYAREYVQENPLLGPTAMAAAIPVYTALKALGIKQARSPASMNEVVQGYAGILDGLRALSQ